MIEAATVSSLPVFRMRHSGLARIVSRAALDQRHDDDTGLEPGQTKRQPRKEEDRGQRHGHRTAVFELKRIAPVVEKSRMQPDLPVGTREHHDVE